MNYKRNLKILILNLIFFLILISLNLIFFYKKRNEDIGMFYYFLNLMKLKYLKANL